MPKNMPKNIEKLCLLCLYKGREVTGMSVEKKGRKWYIRGKIKKDDGTYYEYRRLARGCTGKKEAEEYDRKFKKQYKIFKFRQVI